MIVFDLILATRRPEMTGVERYGVRLFEAVRAVEPDTVALVHDASVFADKRGLIELPSAYRDWLLAPLHLRRLGLAPETIVFPSTPASPLFKFTRTPLMRIVADAFPWTRGFDMTFKGRLLFRDVESFMLSRYDRLCAPMEPVVEEMKALFARSDIEACGNAVNLDLKTPAAPIANAPEKFLLAVGTVEPRKGYDRVIRLAEEAPAGAPAIVIVGRPGWGDIVAQLEAAAQRLPERLIWLRDVDDGALVWLYENATGFVSFSHAEGFNAPLVEAAVSGRAIMCSDLPIHRVVAAPWARLVDPEANPQTLWARLMEGVQATADDVAAYRQRFSWEAVAQRVLRIARVNAA